MFHLDTLSTLVAATLVLLLGRKLVQTVPFLKKYTIPEPVAGGLLVALALLSRALRCSTLLFNFPRALTAPSDERDRTRSQP